MCVCVCLVDVELAERALNAVELVGDEGLARRQPRALVRPADLLLAQVPVSLLLDLQPPGFCNIVW